MMRNKDEDPVLWCLTTVSRHFNNGPGAAEWFDKKVDGKSPREMLRSREFEKVIKLIEEELLKGNDED
jgi:hypothetical protein